MDAIKFTVDHGAVLEARALAADRRLSSSDLNSPLAAAAGSGDGRSHAPATASMREVSQAGAAGGGPASAGGNGGGGMDVAAFRQMKVRARRAAEEGEGCLMCSS